MSANGTSFFSPRESVEAVEEGALLSPRFDENGLLPVAVCDAETNALLMLGYMNEEALTRTIETGEAHYWSRSRECLWKKGESSGMTHEVIEMRIDDDQDALWLRVRVAGLGGSCHVGYRSCFYRSIIRDGTAPARLRFEETEKRFDPSRIYPDTPNPTRL